MKKKSIERIFFIMSDIIQLHIIQGFYQIPKCLFKSLYQMIHDL